MEVRLRCLGGFRFFKDKNLISVTISQNFKRKIKSRICPRKKTAAREKYLKTNTEDDFWERVSEVQKQADGWMDGILQITDDYPEEIHVKSRMSRDVIG